jgi:hypothetical protein
MYQSSAELADGLLCCMRSQRSVWLLSLFKSNSLNCHFERDHHGRIGSGSGVGTAKKAADVPWCLDWRGRVPRSWHRTMLLGWGLLGAPTLPSSQNSKSPFGEVQCINLQRSWPTGCCAACVRKEVVALVLVRVRVRVRAGVRVGVRVRVRIRVRVMGRARARARGQVRSRRPRP